MSAPTYEDAKLMLQLLRLGSEQEIEDAFLFIFSEDFEEDFKEFEKKYPWGSKEFKFAFIVCNWFETVAGLWVNGLLNKKLIYDLTAVGLSWNLLKNYAYTIREKYEDPAIYEHFEALAKAVSE